MTKDPFNLTRFLTAQDGTYNQALAELKRGKKETHWMWFIFPQIDGLGRSEIAIHYAIKSRAEAEAYLQHPTLGPRLAECATALLQIHGRTASDIMGYPDDLKLHSSITLFAAVSKPGSVFYQLLDKYFQSHPDRKTIDILTGPI